MPIIRLTSESSRNPNVTWVRLAVGERDDHAETLDAVVANFTAPIPITEPEQTRDIPTQGNPARGWCTFLKVQEGTDGAELLGHVHWLDDAPAVACAAGSLWARVNIERDAVHPVSGRHLGAKLSGIELVPAPSLTNQPRAALARKDPTMTPETRTILSHLPEFEPKAPNRAAAVEACALEHIPGAKSLPRHALFERIVHPVLNELGKERLRSASNAGRLKMAASPLSGNGRLQPSRPQLTKRPKLDVSGEPGRNQFERLLSHVKRVQPHLSHDAAFAVACDTNRTHEVVS